MKSNGKLSAEYNLVGKLNYPIPEEGVDTFDATAASEDILNGKTAYVKDKKVTGSMTNNGNVEIAPSANEDKLLNKGYYEGGIVKQVTAAIDENILTSNIKSGIAILGVEGTVEELNAQEKTVTPTISQQIILPDENYNAISQINVEPVTADVDSNIKPNFIKKGITILGVDGALEEDKPDQIKTVIPTIVDQEVFADTGYELGKVVIKGVTADIDENIKAENIKSGTSILGVEGTIQEGVDTSDADAISNDIVRGKTAYVNGEKVVGTMQEEYSLNNGYDEIIVNNEDNRVYFKDVLNSSSNKHYINPNTEIMISAPFDVLDSELGITANKILSGNTIIGVEGTATSDADATPSDLTQGKTAYINGVKVEGTLREDDGQWEQNALDVELSDDNILRVKSLLVAEDGISEFIARSGFTKYSTITPERLSSTIGLTADKIKVGETILGINGTAQGEIDTSDANATANDIIKNKTAYVNGQKVTGTLATAVNLSVATVNSVIHNSSYDQCVYFDNLPLGTQIVGETTQIRLGANWNNLANAIGLAANIIKAGVTVLGIEGTVQEGITADKTIQAEDAELETVQEITGNNDIGLSVISTPLTQSKLYEQGSIIEMHPTFEQLATVLGITPEKIKAGEIICGVEGTYTGN